MLVTMQFRIFCYPICYPRAKIKKKYNTKMLFISLHGCETWFLRIREEHRLRVYEKRIFGSEGDTVKGG
jgi:hypothetical protein